MRWGHGLDRSGSGQRQVAGCCECGDEPSGSIKCWEISCLAEDLLASKQGMYSVE